MTTLYQQLGDRVKAIVSGFDRIVFKGSIRQFMFEGGVSSFLHRKGVLNKDYRNWALEQTGSIVRHAEELSLSERKVPVQCFNKTSERKDEIAREVQSGHKLSQGLIGIWWAMELCNSYKARFIPGQTFPEMKASKTKCKHLYYYFDHQDYGFMNIRLQTWFPFHIQVAMNGREWLRRSLDKEGIGYDRHKNKFLHIEDMEAAQRLMHAQLDVDWKSLLNSFLPTVFPSMPEVLLPELSYYWTLWQSEWATDYLFHSYKDLKPVGETLLKHAFMAGTGERVLRYLDRPFTKDERPYASNGNDVKSRMLDFQDGLRVRHWVDSNSVKVYFEQNVLRMEATINDPGMFKVMRNKEGDAPDTKKQNRPMRKGVADVAMRARISQRVNDRMSEQLASCSYEDEIQKVMDGLTKPVSRKGRKTRALDPMGKDRELLLAITDPAYVVNGFTNRMLKDKLDRTIKGLTDKQAAAKISRLLRILRDHGLIAKFPRQRRYRLTAKGRSNSTAVAAILSASTKQLMEIAA